MSDFTFTTRALSPNGTTLMTTIAASRPRMTITTISSTSVKPCSADRRKGVKPSSSSRRRSGFRIRIVTSLSGKRFELQDWQQDGENDRRDAAAHHDDDDRLEQRQSGRGEAVELAFEIIGGAFEHFVEPSGRLARRRQESEQGRKHVRAPHRRRETHAAADRIDEFMSGSAQPQIQNRSCG